MGYKKNPSFLDEKKINILKKINTNKLISIKLVNEKSNPNNEIGINEII
jgi:hypothetical protein